VKTTRGVFALETDALKIIFALATAFQEYIAAWVSVCSHDGSEFLPMVQVCNVKFCTCITICTKIIQRYRRFEALAPLVERIIELTFIAASALILS